MFKNNLIKLKFILFNMFWISSKFRNFKKKISQYGISSPKLFNFFSWTVKTKYFKAYWQDKPVFIKSYIGKLKSREELIYSKIKGDIQFFIPDLLKSFKFHNYNILVYQFLDCQSIYSVKNNISFSDFGFILKQFIDILHYFSSISLIHCDIQPKNILINKEFKIFIIDFEYSIILNQTSLNNFKFVNVKLLKNLGGIYSMKKMVWDDAYSFSIISKEILLSNNFSDDEFTILNNKINKIRALIGQNQYKYEN